MKFPLVHIKIPFLFRTVLGNINVNHIIENCTKVIPSIEHIELSVTFTGNRKIKKLNQRFRNIDAPTDVLSFPMNTINPELNTIYIGDIFISIPKAINQARFYKNSLSDEISLLLTHGYLHLLGKDHDIKSRKKAMWLLQDLILKNLGIHLKIERG
jgi:probable rRNA maturation factor